MLKAFDPLVLHVAESILRRRHRPEALSFGESLDGTRDILLVTARELTDLLAIVPAARALRKRFPLARVHVLAQRACGDVLAGRPEVFGVVPWDPSEPILSGGFLRRVRELRSHAFDLAIAADTGEDRLPRLLAVMTGAKLRLGMHPSGADPTLNLVVAAPVSQGYRPVQGLSFLSFLGIGREELLPSWEIPDGDLRYARRFLELRSKGHDGWLLGVDPAPGKCGVRPSPRKLAWLVERLVAARGALPIILTDDKEASYVNEFKSCLKVRPLEASSRGIRDDLAFTACCDAFLAGNTNLFHFAVALDVPTVGLFGVDEEPRWIPEDGPRRRTFAWKPGQRVAEDEFLGHVDAVRRGGREIPLRMTLSDEPAEVPDGPRAGSRTGA